MLNLDSRSTGVNVRTASELWGYKDVRNIRRRATQKVASGFRYLGDTLDREDYERLAARLWGCSRLVLFDFPDGGGELRYLTKLHCHVRECVTCQAAKAMNYRARFLERIPSFLKDHPKARWLFLTLTQTDVPIQNLRANLRHLNQSWQRMKERKGWPAIGWVRSVEVTREKARPNYAHPHSHVLLCVRPSYFTHGYIKQEEWVSIWRECLRQSPEEKPPIVDIRRWDAGPLNDFKTNAGKLAEAIKYGVKPADMMNAAPEWISELHHQMRGTRAVASGGALAGIFRNLGREREQKEFDFPEMREVFAAQWRERMKLEDSKYVVREASEIEREALTRKFRKLREKGTKSEVESQELFAGIAMNNRERSASDLGSATSEKDDES